MTSYIIESKNSNCARKPFFKNGNYLILHLCNKIFTCPPTVTIGTRSHNNTRLFKIV